MSGGNIDLAEHRVQDYIETVKNKTFYHYYPLLNCMLRDVPHIVDDNGYILVDEYEIYFGDSRLRQPGLEKIWIVDSPISMPGIVEEYDRNYIYDLKTTLGIKNLRMNAKKFLQETKGLEVRWMSGYCREGCTNLLREWYKEYNEATSDFGYTMNLVNHCKEFHSKYELKIGCLYIGDKMMNLSIWGKLDSNNVVYIVCKSLKKLPNGENNIYFVGDYSRVMAYSDMLSEGYQQVNDGSDLGLLGLAQYKMKFRPININPIYSWRSV
jgi:hypothetical protein